MPTGTYSLVYQNSNISGSSVALEFGSTQSVELNQTHGMFKAYTFPAQVGNTGLTRYLLVYQNPLVRHAGCMPQWHPFRRYRETQL